MFEEVADGPPLLLVVNSGDLPKALLFITDLEQLVNLKEIL